MKMPADESEDAKFQMAPMIDMVFLLLVFFMCASHLSSSKNLPLNIPFASKGVVPKERVDRWVVNIDPEGNLFSGMSPVTTDELAAEVKAGLKRNPAMKMYLRADQKTPHKEVRKVMQVVAGCGVDDFIFGVYTPSDIRTGEAQ